MMTTDPFRIVDAPLGTAAPADPATRDALDSFRHVLGASALTFVLWFVPFVGLILYPIRFFVTYVHELCHAFAAVLTLGWPIGVQIFLDTSGVTHTLGGLGMAISSAGYVGTPLVGALLLLLASRRSTIRPALIGLGAIVGLSALWLGANFLAWAGGLAVGGMLLALGLKGSNRATRFGLSFLAIQCMLNALSDLRFLFWLSIGSSAQTDAQNMAAATGGLVPAVVWTTLWAATALGLLGVTLRLYYVTTVRRSIGE